jgi:HK97 family phage major capsid protein
LTWQKLIACNLDFEETYGYTANRMIMNQATAELVLTMTYGDGRPIFEGIMEGGSYPTPLGQNIIVSSGLNNNEVLMVDTSAALIQLVYKAFSTEFERHGKNQVEGSYGTEISAIVPFMQNARILMQP